MSDKSPTTPKIFRLPADVVAILELLPSGARTAYVVAAVREKHRREQRKAKPTDRRPE